MKTLPRHSGLVILEEKTCSGDVLPAEGALALAKATGVPRQRLLDFPFAMNDVGATSPEEVIQLLHELKPAYSTTAVQRGGRIFHVITSRS